MDFDYDVCVIGGCGHVGLPLAITFASEGPWLFRRYLRLRSVWRRFGRLFFIVTRTRS